MTRCLENVVPLFWQMMTCFGFTVLSLYTSVLMCINLLIGYAIQSMWPMDLRSLSFGNMFARNLISFTQIKAQLHSWKWWLIIRQDLSGDLVSCAFGNSQKYTWRICEKWNVELFLNDHNLFSCTRKYDHSKLTSLWRGVIEKVTVRYGFLRG